MVKLVFVFTSLLLAIPCQARTIYVDANAPGANNGTSWIDAYNFLQDALAEANSAAKPVEIQVAQGIYKPDQSSADPNGSGSRAATFQLINGVTLKGGYAGFGEPDPNERDIEFYETILSGDLDGNDVEVNDPCDLLNEPTRAENSYHIVFSQLTDASAVLDGFTITGGNANGTGGYPFFENGGGGLYNGIHMPGSPTLINCTFIENSTWDKGGGMLNSGYFDECNPILTNCTFSRNWAGDGGGMFNNGWYGTCSPKLSNCVFSRNSSSQYGGGVASTGAFCDVTLINCTFTNNSGEFGGGMCTQQATLMLKNCMFTGNSAQNGGGMLNMSTIPMLSNCILSGNEPEEIYGNAIVNYSCIEGGWPGLGNIDADPCFADLNNDDYHLKSITGRWDANSKSWVRDNVSSPCIDAGNPGCSVGDEPVPNGNRRNMGAYGGTAEASKSPPNWRSIADLTNDWVVDSNDLKVFVDHWLQTGECIPSDLNRSQFVDFDDFAIFGLQWSYPSASEPGIFYQVDDCNMEAGQNQPSAADSNDTRFSVRVEGNYIHFKDLITANCCLDEIELQMTVEDGLITIYEIEHLTTPCFCLCDYPTTATLGPFEPGIYLLEVIDIDGKSLGIVEVVIGGSPEPGITYQIEDCNRDASEIYTAEPPYLTRFKVTVEGPYIHFEDMMTANCCPDKLELEMAVEDNLITIYETEYTSAGCRCICSFPITATLGPFEPGTYTLEVYETMGGFIGSTAITIGPGR